MRPIALCGRVFLTLFALLLLGASALSQSAEVGTLVGQKAPDFDLPSLDDPGERVNLYEHVAQSDVTILFFFLAAN